MIKMNIFLKILIFFIFIIPQQIFAGAEGEVLQTTAVGTASNQALGSGASSAVEAAGGGEFAKKLGAYMGSPPGIMILASIGAANSAILKSAAEDQEKECDDNIKKIEKLMAVFKDSWIAYCPNGREALTEPNCYCYKEDGTKNPDRTKSQICIDLWAKNSYKLLATLGDYKGIATNVDPVGCVTVNGQFDEKCACKKFLNAKGDNSCMKSVGINVNGNQLGLGYLASSGFDKVTKALTSQTSGQSNLGSLSPGQLAAAIAKQKKINDALFTKIANDPDKKNFKLLLSDADIKKAQNSIFSKADLASAQGALGNSATAMVGENRPAGNLSDLLKDAEKKAGLDTLGSGRGLQNKKAETKEGINFNFAGDNAAGSAGGTQNFPEAPEKNYNFKNSDISKNSETSIFEIISNRYIQSGLKRLFEN